MSAYYSDAEDAWHHNIPNYLTDLNSMNEAERHAAVNLMDADQWEAYGVALENMHPHATVIGGDYYDFATLMTETTAAQRAEAFLKVLGLWGKTDELHKVQ